ncbi:MAG: WD40 repeat domain-containing protein, partial [Candidatus Magnetominusculus sp. LBB02]|nr:WD40 repeat domain-containing protein [Candidatus Magnetominusculus sp. LBB02]
ATGRVSRTFTGHTGGAHSVCFSPDGWFAYSGSADCKLRSFYIDWEIEARDIKDWDDGARPYAEQFIAIHTPFINNSFTRRGEPLWQELDISSFLTELSLRGYGWLRPDGVAAKLNELKEEAATRWRHREESFNAAIAKAAELMAEGNYPAAYDELNRARSIDGYKQETAALRLYGQMSMVFPKTSLLGHIRQKVLRGHGGAITAAAFTEDELYAVTACKDNRVRIWDLTAGKCILSLSGATVTALVVHGSESVVSGDIDGVVRHWDIKTGAVRRVFRGHSAEINSLQLARGGRFIFSASKDGMMILWDALSGQRVKVYKCPSGSLTCAAIDEDLSFIASGSSDRLIRLWDCKGGGIARVLSGHTDTVMAVAISPDSTFIASGGAARRVRLWDGATGKNIATYEGHSGAVTSIQITPDSRFIISGSADSSVILWNKTQNSPSAAFGGHTAALTSVSISASSGMMITAGDDRTAFVWQMQWAFTIRDFTDWVDGALPFLNRFISNRRNIVNDTLTDVGTPEFKDEDMAVLMDKLRQRGFGWLLAEGVAAKLAELKARLEADCNENTAQYKRLIKSGVDLIRDKHYAKAIEAISSAHALKGFQREDEPLRLLDKMHSVFPRTKLLDVWRISQLTGHRGKITAIAVLSDNKHAITAGADKTLRLWDISTGSCIRVLQGHTGGVTSVAVSADNRLCISAGSDGTMRQWDIVSGECVRVTEAHKQEVKAVVTAPDNRRLLSVGADGVVKLWDSFTGECISQFSADKPVAVAVSPDGMYCYTGGTSAE